MEAAFAAWPGLSRDDARTIAHPPTYQMNSSQTAALINFANDLFYYQFGSDNATRLTMSPAPEVGEEFRPAGRMVNFACRNNSHIVEVATARAGVARFECRRPG